MHIEIQQKDIFKHREMKDFWLTLENNGELNEDTIFLGGFLQQLQYPYSSEIYIRKH